MSLFWKIFWTVVVIVAGFAGIAAITEFFGAIIDLFTGEFTIGQIWTILVGWVIILPMWFMWKGTKLIPIVSNFVVRILTLVVFVGVIPAIAGMSFTPEWLATFGVVGVYAFALIGIWLKS